MAAGILNDEDKRRLNDERLAGASFVGATMRLAGIASLPITHASTLASLVAHEMAFAGYSARPLLAWSASVLTADFHAISFATDVVFNNSSGADSPLIYCWWYYDAAHNNTIIAGVFDNPFIIPAGGSYTVTPSFRLTNE